MHVVQRAVLLYNKSPVCLSVGLAVRNIDVLWAYVLG